MISSRQHGLGKGVQHEKDTYEYQANLFHGSKDGEELLIVGHARLGVGRQAGRVALDSCNAGLLRLADDLWRDGRVKVQCHEVVDGRVQGLKALLVLQGLGDGRHRGDQVGHDICYAVLPQVIIVRRVSSDP